MVAVVGVEGVVVAVAVVVVVVGGGGVVAMYLAKPRGLPHNLINQGLRCHALGSHNLTNSPVAVNKDMSGQSWCQLHERR